MLRKKGMKRFTSPRRVHLDPHPKLSTRLALAPPPAPRQVKPVDQRLQQSAGGAAKLAINLVEFDDSLRRAFEFVFQ